MIKFPEKKERKLIAIDETMLKLENRHIFVWSARDVKTGEILFIWATDGRSSFHASLKKFSNTVRISLKSSLIEDSDIFGPYKGLVCAMSMKPLEKETPLKASFPSLKNKEIP